MALTVSDIASTLVQPAFASRTATGPTAQALQKSLGRVEQKLESTRVQLSSFGQIKSALDQVATAGKALGDTQKLATAADTKKAVQGFVDAYNQANNTIGVATRGDGKQAGALANESRAIVAGNDLRRALSSGNTLSELGKLGIKQNGDGSLTLDTKALDKALQTNATDAGKTLSRIGGQVAQTASNEIAGSGHVGAALNILNTRSASLESQRQSQEDSVAQLQAAQADSQNQAQRGNLLFGAFSTGTAAYQRLFSG